MLLLNEDILDILDQAWLQEWGYKVKCNALGAYQASPTQVVEEISRILKKKEHPLNANQH